MSSNRTTVFVDEWLCYDTILGEGAYGEVKLLINRVTEEKVACKIIDYKNDGNTKTAIQREVLIHRRLIHENVVRYLGRRQELNKEYIFLEYAPGGELFQLIEPDVGMSPRLVQDYMKQLLCGIKYIHSVGIAHRDIKPENILIGNNGVLKISDFGMATLFRHKGFERLLSKRCGTKPYLAPEVLKLIPYKAQPADIWSCGIVFVAMLTGELPWSEPTSDNPEFSKWCNQIYILASPWTKLGTASLSLAKQILTVEVEKRLTLEQIENHVWLRNNFSREGTSSTPCNKDHKAQRWHSVVEAETHNNRDLPDAVQSQPLPVSRPPSLDKYTTDANEIRREQVSFSQPTQNDNLMIQFTQSPITKDNFHNLVKRMTRFYVSTNNEETVTHLCKALDSYHCTWTIDGTGVLTITMVDRMKNNVVFKANIFDMDGNILVDFRLSKGCGLEFKKKFLKIKDYLRDIIVKYN